MFNMLVAYVEACVVCYGVMMLCVCTDVCLFVCLFTNKVTMQLRFVMVKKLSLASKVLWSPLLLRWFVSVAIDVVRCWF